MVRAQHFAPKDAGTSMNQLINTRAAPGKERCDFALLPLALCCAEGSLRRMEGAGSHRGAGTSGQSDVFSKYQREMGVKMMARRGEVIDPRPK